ncbi:MAG TPA: F0F1 ATP synthase subunit B [Candidatus Acidoferrum sp.]|nr:F0F1 ATP synthase subunit B [Candidatus Acidoferrum sp.]
MNLLALIGVPHLAPAVQAAAADTGAGLQINFFWVIVSSLNFILFLVLANLLFGKTLSTMLASRRTRIEQGLRDAEQARTDRANAEAERTATLAEARREARELLERAQKVAQETRDADIAATKAELERLRERATVDIEAEKVRAVADLRAEVADLALAAAGKVVGASMTGDTQRRLVDDFLKESAGSSSNASRN